MDQLKALQMYCTELSQIRSQLEFRVIELTTRIQELEAKQSELDKLNQVPSGS